VVHHLVQEHREVEDREALNEHERRDQPRIRGRDEKRRRRGEQGELARGNQQVARRPLRMERAQPIARHGAAELVPQPRRMLRVEVRLHVR